MLDYSKPVILIHPEKGEEKIIYKIVNINEPLKRCVIQPTNMDFEIAPLELVSFNDIKNL